MRKLFVLLLLCPFMGQSQNSKLGIKLGLNFANVRNASSINASNSTGFMIGAFRSRGMGKMIVSNTELYFSRQGYNFSTNTNTGNVDLNYILFSQMMGIRITKFVLIQFGGMTGYLLNAKTDSSSSLTSMMNRFDVGYAGGVEIFPYKGIVIGARINVSVASTFKDGPSTGNPASFNPGIDAKNNVLQVFLGYRFNND